MIIVGDIHLPRHGQEALGRDLARLIDATEGDIVLSGDIYDLAALGEAPVEQRLAEIIEHHAAAHAALKRATDNGRGLVLTPGNHDMEMIEPKAQALFALHTGGRVQAWFVRVGGEAHIEHGSQYDPDNAHPHPLAADGDPLGVMVTRQLIARLGDLQLLAHNDSTPLPLLIQCFARYGLRTPEMVARYCYNGVATLLAGDRGIAKARAVGREKEVDMAAASGLASEKIRALAELSVAPRRADRWSLLRRMYLDRIALTGIIMTLAALAATGVVSLPPLSWGLVAAALFFPNRYRGTVADHLQSAAAQVAEVSGTRWVIERYGEGSSTVEASPLTVTEAAARLLKSTVAAPLVSTLTSPALPDSSIGPAPSHTISSAPPDKPVTVTVPLLRLSTLTSVTRPMLAAGTILGKKVSWCCRR